MDLNPNLRKSGMKFAHVNIVTLPGHSADVDVLLEETNLDLLGLTEMRLDSTIPDSQICPEGYACYRKDRNRNGGGCAVFLKNKCDLLWENGNLPFFVKRSRKTVLNGY